MRAIFIPTPSAAKDTISIVDSSVSKGIIVKDTNKNFIGMVNHYNDEYFITDVQSDTGQGYDSLKELIEAPRYKGYTFYQV